MSVGISCFYPRSHQEKTPCFEMLEEIWPKSEDSCDCSPEEAKPSSILPALEKCKKAVYHALNRLKLPIFELTAALPLLKLGVETKTSPLITASFILTSHGLQRALERGKPWLQQVREISDYAKDTRNDLRQRLQSLHGKKSTLNYLVQNHSAFKEVADKISIHLASRKPETIERALNAIENQAKEVFLADNILRGVRDITALASLYYAAKS